MMSWLSSEFVVLFGACVPPALIFAVLDVITNVGLKLAFLGKSNMRVGGGKLHG